MKALNMWVRHSSKTIVVAVFLKENMVDHFFSEILFSMDTTHGEHNSTSNNSVRYGQRILFCQQTKTLFSGE